MTESQSMKPSPNQVLMAVVQSQDTDSTEDALSAQGFSVTRLPSYGGFLGRRNVTLLIALHASQREQALKTLQENCRQRVEYISVPMESAPLPLPTPTPITIGGATIFTLEVEHYEEIKP